MGQSEIMEWMAQERFKSNKFFSVKEIEAAMLAKGLSILRIRSQLNALYVYHYLDIRVDKHFIRHYRLRFKYMDEYINKKQVEKINDL